MLLLVVMMMMMMMECSALRVVWCEQRQSEGNISRRRSMLEEMYTLWPPYCSRYTAVVVVIVMMMMMSSKKHVFCD